MFTDVENKRKRKNKILFSRESKCLSPLVDLIRKQKHRTMVLWAFECVKEPLRIFEEKYPEENRPRRAVELADRWSRGEVKMREAQRAILDCHKVCKELDDEYYIAICHGIGQGVSTTHVETHAIGLPSYELTSIVLANPDGYEKQVNDKIGEYIKTLKYFEKNVDNIERPWAEFIARDTMPNREELLWRKKSICKDLKFDLN